MRLPLIDGQGNFGSMDGDPPAAMRYTESRLAKVADSLLDNVDEDTVNFQPNYDGSEREPVVLPARFPNLLVNGAGGIAVGMATNMAPHNLGEVLAACRAYIDNSAISNDELMAYVPAPDFPTGGIILGRGGAANAYRTGKGSVIVRARSHIETFGKERQALIFTEIPYQVNKANLVGRIAELVKEKRIEGIGDIRDESSREGVRIVVELKRDAVADVVLNQLFRYTALQSSFAINALAINGGRPQQMTLRDIISAFISFREEVITRRTKFQLGKARDRAHILIGLVIAVTNLDEVVAIIRGAATPAAARAALQARAWPIATILPYLLLVDDVAEGTAGATYHLTDTQVAAILDLRLNRLTQLGQEEIAGELKTLAEKIAGLLDILRDRTKLYAIMQAEFDEVASQFVTPRRSEIASGDFGDIDDEDLIQREDMVVIVTLTGYIKRVPLSAYRAQKRGGKGRSAMATKEEDVVTRVFVANTHTPVLFFSSLGQVYRMKVYKLPEGTPQSRGKAMVNLLPLAQGETISAILPLPEDEAEWAKLHVLFATARGSVRRNSMDAFTNIPSNGKIAIRFEEGIDDRLIGVSLCEEGDEVLLAARGGKSIRFEATDVREFQSRTSTGVRGMDMDADDEVISLSILRANSATSEERELYLRAAPWKNTDAASPELSAERMAEMAAAEQFILTVTRNGYGKRSSSYEYRTTGRGGKGIVNIDTSERNGDVVASFPVEANDDIMLVSDQGQLIRTPVAQIRIAGRATQGVTLFKVADGEHVVSVAHITDDGAETDTAADDGTDSA